MTTLSLECPHENDFISLEDKDSATYQENKKEIVIYDLWNLEQTWESESLYRIKARKEPSKPTKILTHHKPYPRKQKKKEKRIQREFEIFIVLKLWCFIPPQCDYKMHIYSVCLHSVTIYVAYTSICVKYPIIKVISDVPRVGLPLGYFLF